METSIVSRILAPILGGMDLFVAVVVYYLYKKTNDNTEKIKLLENEKIGRKEAAELFAEKLIDKLNLVEAKFSGSVELVTEKITKLDEEMDRLIDKALIK